MEPGTVLLVDDDPVFSRVLVRALQQRGFIVESAQDLQQGQASIADHAPDFAILDLNVGGASGLRLIAPLKDANPRSRILILTGYASIATAVDAIKLGADQYLSKPVEVDAIVKALTAAEAPNAEAAPQEPLSVSRLEWEHIQRLLTEHDGNISATARALKMHRRTLQRKLAKRPAK